MCGARGWADVIANVLLYAPLGATLALVGWTGPRPIVFGFVLSCVIEFAQFLIPGRDPSLADVTCNTIGAAVGEGAMWLARHAPLWQRQTIARLSLISAAVAIAVFLLTATLFIPAQPTPPFSVQYNADLPDMPSYHGRMLSTRSGAVEFRPDRAPDSVAVARLLTADATLEMDVVAGPRMRSLAPMFLIADRSGEEVLLVGPDRDDLVLRYRTHAAEWRLDRPDLRLRRAFASVSVGDTIHITIRRYRDGFCLSLNALSRCPGFTLGSGWALIFYARHLRPWMLTLLEALWLVALTFPVGLWAGRRIETVFALGLLFAALFAIPSLTGLARTPIHEVLGAVLGVLSGGGVQAWLRQLRFRRSAE